MTNILFIEKKSQEAFPKLFQPEECGFSPQPSNFMHIPKPGSVFGVRRRDSTASYIYADLDAGEKPGDPDFDGKPMLDPLTDEFDMYELISRGTANFGNGPELALHVKLLQSGGTAVMQYPSLENGGEIIYPRHKPSDRTREAMREALRAGDKNAKLMHITSPDEDTKEPHFLA